MNIELDYIKTLVSYAVQNSLTELKVEDGDKKIVIKKELCVFPTQNFDANKTIYSVQSNPENAQEEPSFEPAKDEKAPSKPQKKGNAVLSPIFGTFYSSPSPGSPTFVKVGERVEVGQTLCIIESMKLMNEIESEVAGIVTEICFDNSDPVEEGAVLMYIE